MNAETLEALKGSIEHWGRLVDFENNPGEEPTYRQCDLCKLALNKSERFYTDCNECVVKLKTGQRGCVGTPFNRAYSAFFKRHDNPEEFRHAAKEELEFLKSLLPKGGE